MKQIALRYGLLVAGLAVACFVVGCGGGGEASHEGHDHGSESTAGAGEGGGVAAALAELSEEERALAEKQKTCPISEEALGSMGKPYALVLEGETIFLCCSGCKDKAEGDVEGTLAKVAELRGEDGSEGGE